MKIYCLNLNRRPDRWEECKKQFKKYNIKVERFEATDGNQLPKLPEMTSGEVGIIHSYIRILQDAIKNKYKSILIYEDDIELVDNFTETFELYMRQVPHDWEIINLGGFNNRKRLNFVDKNIYKMEHTLTTHAIMFKNTVYSDILEMISKYKHTLDVALSVNYYRYKSYGMYPAIVIQKRGYSDIQNRTMDMGRLIRINEKYNGIWQQ